MYTPKISEALIPRIYRAAKEAKLPMTTWVNQAVERALPKSAASQQVSPTVTNGHEHERTLIVQERVQVQKSVDFMSGRIYEESEVSNGEH